jgi:hypothetical protein
MELTKRFGDEQHYRALDSWDWLDLGAYQRRGLRLGPDQIYAWAPPPTVTGSFAADEIEAFGFVPVVHVAGQVHDRRHGRAAG